MLYNYEVPLSATKYYYAYEATLYIMYSCFIVVQYFVSVPHPLFILHVFTLGMVVLSCEN